MTNKVKFLIQHITREIKDGKMEEALVEFETTSDPVADNNKARQLAEARFPDDDVYIFSYNPAYYKVQPELI